MLKRQKHVHFIVWLFYFLQKIMIFKTQQAQDRYCCNSFAVGSGSLFKSIFTVKAVKEQHDQQKSELAAEGH